MADPTPQRWRVITKGGAYDGIDIWLYLEGQPTEVAIFFRCSEPTCNTVHMCFDPENPQINIQRAVAYKRTDLDAEQSIAVYTIGEGLDSDGERNAEKELVTTGGGFGDSFEKIERVFYDTYLRHQRPRSFPLPTRTITWV